MSITVVVEDGSIVENANSYVSLETARSYADSRNLSLPDADDELAQMLIVAMDYLMQYEPLFRGSRVSPLQELAWPRQSVFINGFTIPATKIPQQLINAQCQLAVDATALDGTLAPTQSEYAIKSEVLGPLSTTYAIDTVNGSSTFKPVFTQAEMFLKPLFARTVGGCYR